MTSRKSPLVKEDPVWLVILFSIQVVKHSNYNSGRRRRHIIMLSLLEMDAVLLLISSYIVEDISGKTDEKLEMIKEKKKFRLLRYSMKKLNKIDPRMFS